MVTLTESDVIISVSAIFGIILLTWLVSYFIYSERHKNSIPSEKYLQYRSTKIVYIFTLLGALAACILMIIYSIGEGVPANSAQ